MRVSTLQDNAIGSDETLSYCLIRREGAYAFVFVAKEFTRVHPVIVVPVSQHPAGNGIRGVLLVGKQTDFLVSLDECPVKFMPRSPGEGNDVHVVVGKHEAVCQYLQGIEVGV